MTDDEALAAIREGAAVMQARLRELADRHRGAVPQALAYRALASVSAALDAVADLDGVLKDPRVR